MGDGVRVGGITIKYSIFDISKGDWCVVSSDTNCCSGVCIEQSSSSMLFRGYLFSHQCSYKRWETSHFLRQSIHKSIGWQKGVNCLFQKRIIFSSWMIPKMSSPTKLVNRVFNRSFPALNVMLNTSSNKPYKYRSTERCKHQSPIYLP